MENQMINPSSKVRAKVPTGKITVVDFIKIFIVESRKILSITRIGFDCAICGSAIISPKNGQKKFLSQISKHLLRSEEHTSELQSRGHLVCRLLLEKKNIY